MAFPPSCNPKLPPSRAIIVGAPQRPWNVLPPFSSANGQPQKERDWLVIVPQRDGSVIFMVFVAPHSEFERFQPTYEAMLKSVQFSAQ